MRHLLPRRWAPPRLKADPFQNLEQGMNGIVLELLDQRASMVIGLCINDPSPPGRTTEKDVQDETAHIAVQVELIPHSLTDHPFSHPSECPMSSRP